MNKGEEATVDSLHRISHKEIRETSCSRELLLLSLHTSHKSSHLDLMALDVGFAFSHAHADKELHIGLRRNGRLCQSGSYIGNLRQVCVEQEADATLL